MVNGSAFLWDIGAGKKVRTFSGGVSGVEATLVNPDGTLGVTRARHSGETYFYDLSSGKTVHAWKDFANGVHAIAFSPDGKLLLAGRFDGSTELWDIATSETIRSFAGDGSVVDEVAFNPDMKVVLTRSWSHADPRFGTLPPARKLAQFHGNERRQGLADCDAERAL